MSAPVDRPSPRQLTAWSALLVEASALALAGGAALVLVLTGRGGYPVVGLALGGTALAVAAGLVGAVRALRAGRARAVAPVVTWQLLQGATAGAVLGAVTPQTPGVVVVLAWAGLGLAGLIVALLLTEQRRRNPVG